MTTCMQVASRILVVTVLTMFPEIVVGRQVSGIGKMFRWGVDKGKGGDWAEVGILLAWGITECIRYGYFVYNLRGMGVPGWLTWLR